MTDHTPTEPSGHARVILVGVEGGRPDTVLLSAAELARDLGSIAVTVSLVRVRADVQIRSGTAPSSTRSRAAA